MYKMTASKENGDDFTIEWSFHIFKSIAILKSAIYALRHHHWRDLTLRRYDNGALTIHSRSANDGLCCEVRAIDYTLSEVIFLSVICFFKPIIKHVDLRDGKIITTHFFRLADDILIPLKKQVRSADNVRLFELPRSANERKENDAKSSL